MNDHNVFMFIVVQSQNTLLGLFYPEEETLRCFDLV